MNDEMTPEDINTLRAYLATESGRKFLMLLVNQETTLLAEAYGSKSSLEKQGQNVNRVAGLYWVRTLIQSLVDKK